ncbi:MAG TPA: hypothetical protein VK348_13580 [Planctomycetota bacterium]|nr:hypothetical protein [Planctomycetota bacterium]
MALPPKKVLLALAAVPLLYFGGRAAWRALASDATRIRWLLQDEVSAFNGGNVGDVLAGFADGYRDTTAGIDRNDLHQCLLYVLLQRSQGMHYRAELHDDTAIEPDGNTARASFGLALDSGMPAQQRPRWELQVDAELAKTPAGWQFVHSTHRTLAGTPPR